MFARAAAPLAQAFNVVVAVVPFRIFTPKKAILAVASGPIEIEHILHEEHPHRFGDGNLQSLLFDDVCAVERHAHDRLTSLTAQQQASFRILRHANPRSIFCVGFQNVFDRKAWKRLQDFHRSNTRIKLRRL